MPRSSLFEAHTEAGGIIGNYLGWEVPTDYGDPEGEFAASRTGSVIFDASLSGSILVTGDDRLDLLHRLSTNDIAHARAGTVVPTLFLTDKGKIIDRVVVYIRENSLLLLTSPGKEEILTEWIGKYTITENIILSSVTSDTVRYYLFGPRAASTLQHAYGTLPPQERWIPIEDGGASLSLEREAGGTGEYFVVMTGTGSGRRLWEKLTGSREGARRIGSTAFETNRIDHGIPFAGGELTGAFNPFETGLTADISFTKGCYIGQEVIARLDTYQKVRRGLSGLRSAKDLRGTVGQRLFRHGRDIGILTSLAPLRVDGEYPGLCVVGPAEAEPGTTVTIGESGPEATLTALPVKAGT